MIERKCYRITLTAVEPLHLGSKDDPISDAENQVAVVGDRLCIPGPSLKGAYRHNLERWLFASFFGDNRWQDESLMPCLAGTKPSPQEWPLVNKRRYRSGKCELRGQSICPACYALGGMGVLGFVRVPFLFAPVDDTREALYSARIDRATGTVAPRANRSYQIVPLDVQFQGELEITLRDPFLEWEFGKKRRFHEGADIDRWLDAAPVRQWDRDRFLKELVIDRLQSIDRLGGYRSKGCGKVSIRLEPTES